MNSSFISLTKLLVMLYVMLFCPLLALGQYVQMGNELLGSNANEHFGFSTATNQEKRVIAIGMPDFISNIKGKIQTYEWHK